MKKQLALAALGLGAAVLAPLAASAQIPIPTRPIWSSVDQPGMTPLPTFFSDTWEATYTGTVYVTDFAVPGDGYDIFQPQATKASSSHTHILASTHHHHRQGGNV